MFMSMNIVGFLKSKAKDCWSLSLRSIKDNSRHFQEQVAHTQHHTTDYSYYGFKTIISKLGTPSLLHLPCIHVHEIPFKTTVYKEHSDLYLYTTSITACEVVRLGNTQWYTV